VFGDDLVIQAHHDPIGIGANLDSAPRRPAMTE
jgi:hypothetical protein